MLQVIVFVFLSSYVNKQLCETKNFENWANGSRVLRNFVKKFIDIFLFGEFASSKIWHKIVLVLVLLEILFI